MESETGFAESKFYLWRSQLAKVWSFDGFIAKILKWDFIINIICIKELKFGFLSVKMSKISWVADLLLIRFCRRLFVLCFLFTLWSICLESKNLCLIKTISCWFYLVLDYVRKQNPCTFKAKVIPWLVWLSGWVLACESKSCPLDSQYMAHAWVVGQVPSRGC